MPKTSFVNGTSVITAEWLNKAYQEDGGHKHDGVDSDGHAQKIDLNTEFKVGTNATLTATVDTGGAHDLTHAHTSGGVARFLTDQLAARGGRVDLADAATASQRLALANLPKMLLTTRYNPATGVWANVAGKIYNQGSGMVAGASAYEITPTAIDDIIGVVQISLGGLPMLLMEKPPRALASWDGIDGHLEIALSYWDGADWVAWLSDLPDATDIPGGDIFIDITLW